MWFVINTRDDSIHKTNDLGRAKEFYNQTCVNLKENNCWGILLNRTENTFPNAQEIQNQPIVKGEM